MTLRSTSFGRSAGFAMLDWIRILGEARHSLLEHGLLHGELVGIELEQAKLRLVRVLLFALAGLSALTCTLLWIGVLVLAASWDTAYRVPAMVAMLLVYGITTFALWRGLRSAIAGSGKGFAASFEELAADAALLRTPK